jgi:2-polyprenyl-6-hydroxyphenyl methylase / 3-demethylubiquinone-9 3-methyltransferase
MQAARQAGVSPEEIARFDALAAQWWDPAGPMRPLHAMNRLRVDWVLSRVRQRYPGPVRILDVGCGAGLAAEAFARAGHDVLGLDAAAEALEAGRAHAEGQGLALRYREGLAEDLLAEGARFPVITALEVIEHVPDPMGFLADLAGLLAPGGLLFVSTMNRTPRALLTAKLAAEYVLRWLPAGTHDWRKFVTPVEMGHGLRDAGLRVADITGMAPDLLTGRWRTSRDLAVNYMEMAAS